MQNKQLEAYAKTIIKHEEEHEEVKRRIAAKLLDRFRRGDSVMRDSVAAIINAEDIFQTELRIIIAENQIQEDS